MDEDFVDERLDESSFEWKIPYDRKMCQVS